MSAALFYYTARNAEGAFVRGCVEADSAASALSNLRTRALFVTSLVNGKSADGILARTLHIGPVSHGALVSFFRSFATLVAAGVAIQRALNVCIEQCSDKRLSEALGAVVADIERGLSLSEAMSRRPKEFSRLFVAMIRAGEAGGVLDDVLNRLASFLEREHAVRRKLMAALTYPAVVFATAIALVIFLMSTILPQFAQFFDDLHVDIPTITQVLISVGTVLRNPRFWLVAALLIVLLVVFISRVIGTSGGALWWDQNKLRIPIFGAIMRKTALARLTRMLGSLLHSGVGLVFSLEVVADVVGNAAYRQSIHGVREALREGDAFAQPLAANPLYDAMLVQMVRVGEESGSLDAMLLRLADFYELEVETALAALGATLEPLLILLLGGIVGFIVFSIFVPLYTLIGDIK